MIYIYKLERIQRRVIKMIPELRDLSYERRLLKCGLTTLETMRLRGYQIEVFKIVKVMRILLIIITLFIH